MKKIIAGLEHITGILQQWDNVHEISEIERRLVLNKLSHIYDWVMSADEHSLTQEDRSVAVPESPAAVSYNDEPDLQPEVTSPAPVSEPLVPAQAQEEDPKPAKKGLDRKTILSLYYDEIAVEPKAVQSPTQWDNPVDLEQIGGMDGSTADVQEVAEELVPEERAEIATVEVVANAEEEEIQTLPEVAETPPLDNEIIFVEGVNPDTSKAIFTENGNDGGECAIDNEEPLPQDTGNSHESGGEDTSQRQPVEVTDADAISALGSVAEAVATGEEGTGEAEVAISDTRGDHKTEETPSLSESNGGQVQVAPTSNTDETEWPENIRPGVETPQKQEYGESVPVEKNGEILGETINSVYTVADALGKQQAAIEDVASQLASGHTGSLRESIGINDKFMLVRDLFDGDSDIFEIAISCLDQFADLNEALIYLNDNFARNPNSEGMSFIVELLTRKLS